MKSNKMALTFAERCRNIMAANWRAHMNTVKADAKGSKEDICTSKVHYMFKRGKPYIWVQPNDVHNLVRFGSTFVDPDPNHSEFVIYYDCEIAWNMRENAIIDERASLSLSSVVPGPLMSLLKSAKRLPARVALAGDIRILKDDKVQVVLESLAESVLSEHETVRQASYAVSSILSSASPSCRSRSEHLQWILNENDDYNVYKFNIRSCTYIDGNGGTHEVELNEIEATRTDPLLPFSERLIDGINQSHARRRALMLFCLEYYNTTARDALILSVDRKGFDVIAKVPEKATNSNIIQQYNWKEFRFSFKEEALDIETFCSMLVELEEEALQRVKSYSGLG